MVELSKSRIYYSDLESCGILVTREIEDITYEGFVFDLINIESSYESLVMIVEKYEKYYYGVLVVI